MPLFKTLTLATGFIAGAVTMALLGLSMRDGHAMKGRFRRRPVMREVHP